MSEIVAMGACTPIGLWAEAAAAAYFSEISGIQLHPRFIDAGGARVSMAFVEAVESTREADRMAELALAAIRDMLTQPDGGGQEADLLLSLPAYRPGFGPEDARALVEKIRGSVESAFSLREVVTGQYDQAGGVMAIATAMNRIANGGRRHCIVVATDSYIGADSLDWFEAHQRLKTVTNPFGLIPGEAAAAMLVGPATSRNRVQVIGGGLRREIADESPGPYLGRALSRALLDATAPLAERETPIRHLFVDLNGEIWRTDSFGNALMRASSRFALGESFNVTANRVGETGAAFGVLAGILAAVGSRTRMLEGRFACICGSATSGGARAAVLLDLGERPTQ